MIVESFAQVITVMPDGLLNVRTDAIYTKDGVEVFRRHSRKLLEPGEDVSSASLRVRAICNVLWTPAVIQAYQDAKAAREATGE
jgi:hypothetical protein